MENLKDTLSAITVSGGTLAVASIDTVEDSLKIILLVLSIAYTIVKIMKERK